MVLDQHQVALGVLRVHPAAGVADDQHVAAQRLHHPDREGDLLERVALVEVEPPLHRRRPVLPAERAADELPLVRRGGRVREVRDRRVGDGDGVRDVLGQPAQAGAEDDAGDGRSRPLRPDEGGGLLDLVEQVSWRWPVDAAGSGGVWWRPPGDSGGILWRAGGSQSGSRAGCRRPAPPTWPRMAWNPSYRAPHPSDCSTPTRSCRPARRRWRPHERALLDAVLADPDADEPRLRYAEWCDRQGDERGEFIRDRSKSFTAEGAEAQREDRVENAPELNCFSSAPSAPSAVNRFLQPFAPWSARDLVFRRGFAEAMSLAGRAFISISDGAVPHHPAARRAARRGRSVTWTSWPGRRTWRSSTGSTCPATGSARPGCANSAALAAPDPAAGSRPVAQRPRRRTACANSSARRGGGNSARYRWPTTG